MFKKLMDTVNQYEMTTFGWVMAIVFIGFGVLQYGLTAIPYGLALFLLIIIVGIAYKETTKDKDV